MLLSVCTVERDWPSWMGWAYVKGVVQALLVPGPEVGGFVLHAAVAQGRPGMCGRM